MEGSAAQLFQRQRQHGTALRVGTDFAEIQRQSRPPIGHGIVEREILITGERQRCGPHRKLTAQAAVHGGQAIQILEGRVRRGLRCVEPALAGSGVDRCGQAHGVGLEFLHPHGPGTEHDRKAVGIGGLHVEAIAARGRAFGDGPAQLGKAVGPDDELPPQDRPFRGIGQFREEGHVGRQRLPVAPAHEHTETQRLAGPEDAAFAEHIGVDAVGVAGLPLRGEARIVHDAGVIVERQPCRILVRAALHRNGHGDGPLFAVQAGYGGQGRPAPGVGHGFGHGQAVGSEDMHRCAGYGIAFRQRTHEDIAASVGVLLHNHPEIRHQQETAGGDDFLVAVHAHQFNAHEPAPIFEQRSHVEHRKLRHARIGALERDDAFLHVAEGVERNIRIGKRLRLRGKKAEIRLEDARSPPADGGQAAGVEIQLALSSEGKHVAGLEEIKLRLERGGMEDFPPRPCQRKGGAWPEPLGKIQEKITVRRYGHPEAQRARRLIGGLERLDLHGLGTVEDRFVDNRGLGPRGGLHGSFLKRAGQLERGDRLGKGVGPHEQTRLDGQAVFPGERGVAGRFERGTLDTEQGRGSRGRHLLTGLHLALGDLPVRAVAPDLRRHAGQRERHRGGRLGKAQNPRLDEARPVFTPDELGFGKHKALVGNLQRGVALHRLTIRLRGEPYVKRNGPFTVQIGINPQPAVHLEHGKRRRGEGKAWRSQLHARRQRQLRQRKRIGRGFRPRILRTELHRIPARPPPFAGDVRRKPDAGDNRAILPRSGGAPHAPIVAVSFSARGFVWREDHPQRFAALKRCGHSGPDKSRSLIRSSQRGYGDAAQQYKKE